MIMDLQFASSLRSNSLLVDALDNDEHYLLTLNASVSECFGQWCTLSADTEWCFWDFAATVHVSRLAYLLSCDCVCCRSASDCWRSLVQVRSLTKPTALSFWNSSVSRRHDSSRHEVGCITHRASADTLTKISWQTKIHQQMLRQPV